MTRRRLRYHVGNEHDPGDPWGRSELVIQPDGTLRLDHHFSRTGGVGAWTGRIDPHALQALWAALDQAGLPTAPVAPGAAPRRLVIENDGVVESVVVGYHEAASLPGYAEAFDILDGVIRQLSGDTLTYPTRQAAIVRDAAEAPST